MDPKLVYQRPVDSACTPLQRIGFGIVDRYIQQDIPAILLFTHKGASQVPENVASEDERVNYHLIVKDRGTYIRVEGWDKPDGTVRTVRLHRNQVTEDMFFELQRRELAILDGQGSGDDELPLSEADFRAIGIANEAPAQPAAESEEVNDGDNEPARTEKATSGDAKRTPSKSL